MNFPHGLCTWSWDLTGDRVSWSNSLFRLFGLDPSQPPPNWEAHSRIYSAESFSRLEAAVNECLRSGLDYMLDLEAIDMAGRILNLQAHGTARRNEQGEIIGLTGVVIDRTLLMTAEEKFRAIADYTVDWESWFGPDGKYLWVNPAVERMTGYSPEEILAMQDFISILIAPEDCAVVGSKLKEALDGINEGRGSDLEVQCLRKDGSRFWLSVSWQQIFDRQGKLLGLRASGRDISRRKLEEKEMLLARRALNNISQGVVIADSDRWIISVNKAFTAITGYPEEEVLGKNCKFLQGPQTDSETVERIRNALNNGAEFHGKIQNCRKDGTAYWNELSISPVRDERGQVTHFVGIARDVTARTEAEKGLSEKSSQLRAILESPQGMVFFSIDREYRYNEFSTSHWKTMKKIWGMEIKIGMRILDLISNPEDEEKAKANFDRALQGEHFVMEEEYGDKDRHRLYYENHYNPIRDERGAVIGLSCFVIDITAKKKAEATARSQEDRINQLINTITDRVYFKDLESRMIMVNQQILDENGIKDVSELSGIADGRFFPAELAAKYREEERLLMESGRPLVNAEEFQILKDGTSRWMLTTKVPMRDEKGTIIGLMGISRDITDLKLKEADLRKKNLELEALHEQEEAQRIALEETAGKALAADRAKGEFLGVMSHELRTPLNGILGFADLLLDDRQISPDVRDKIALIQSSGQSLLRILEDILDFSRVEGGGLKLQNIPFSPSELAWKAIRLVEPEANAKSLQLSVVVGEKVPGTVLGDPERIQQVLLNLLRNAVKYTERGSVSLSLGLASGGKNLPRICFSVEDTGIGIPADQQEKIFLPFTQGDSTLSRKFDGIGIGLTIARRLLEKMGSDLTVKSMEGAGSVFSFEPDLPKATSVTSTGKSEDSDLGELDKEFAKRFPLRILGVDDNPMNLKLWVTQLGKLGYKDILTATHGGEALAVLEKERMDCIFMDLQMPVMDGMEATRRIRSLEAGNPSESPVRIIALTANASTSIRNECFAVGMNHYISKPFNTRSLAEALVIRN